MYRRIFFSVLPHSRRLNSLQIFCFDILNLKLVNFSNSEREGKYISQRELEVATRSSCMYSMLERTDVRTWRVCLQQRSSKVTWNYAWNLTLRRWINVPVNSKTAHPPPPGQTPGHLTFLKNFGQIPRHVAKFRRSNAPPVRASKRVKSPTLQAC